MIRVRVLSPIKYRGVIHGVDQIVHLDEKVFADLAGVEVAPEAEETPQEIPQEIQAPAPVAPAAEFGAELPAAEPPPPAPAIDAGAPQHVCTICGRTFKTPQSLRAHMRAHKPR